MFLPTGMPENRACHAKNSRYIPVGGLKGLQPVDDDEQAAYLRRHIPRSLLLDCVEALEAGARGAADAVSRLGLQRRKAIRSVVGMAAFQVTEERIAAIAQDHGATILDYGDTFPGTALGVGQVVLDLGPVLLTKATQRIAGKMPAANATRRRGSLHNWHCDGRGDLFADELPPTPAGSTFVVITALRHETDPGQWAGIAIGVPDRDFTRWLFHQDVWRFLEGYDSAEGEVGPQPKPPLRLRDNVADFDGGEHEASQDDESAEGGG